MKVLRDVHNIRHFPDETNPDFRLYLQIVFVAAALLAFASAHSFEDDPEFNEFFDSLPSEPAGRVGRAQASYYPPTDQKTYVSKHDGSNMVLAHLFPLILGCSTLWLCLRC